MSRVLMIDNYDSFTYNLVQYLAELGGEVTVWRNDEFELDGVADFAPDLIVVSPGPSVPENAGLSMPLIEPQKIGGPTSVAQCSIVTHPPYAYIGF